MRLFLLTFFLLYGGLHYYLFVKANAALALGTLSSLILILVMLFMVFAPCLFMFLKDMNFFPSPVSSLSSSIVGWVLLSLASVVSSSSISIVSLSSPAG